MWVPEGGGTRETAAPRKFYRLISWANFERMLETNGKH